MNEPANFQLNPSKIPVVGSPNPNTANGDIADQSDVDTFFFETLNEAAVAIAVTNQPAVAQLFQNANNRIYQAFLGIDNPPAPLPCNQGRAPPDVGSTGWAGAYASFIQAYLPARNAEIQTCMLPHIYLRHQTPRTTQSFEIYNSKLDV